MKGDANDVAVQHRVGPRHERRGTHNLSARSSRSPAVPGPLGAHMGLTFERDYPSGLFLAPVSEKLPHNTSLKRAMLFTKPRPYSRHSAPGHQKDRTTFHVLSVLRMFSKTTCSHSLTTHSLRGYTDKICN